MRVLTLIIIASVPLALSAHGIDRAAEFHAQKDVHATVRKPAAETHANATHVNTQLEEQHAVNRAVDRRVLNQEAVNNAVENAETVNNPTPLIIQTDEQQQ